MGFAFAKLYESRSLGITLERANFTEEAAKGLARALPEYPELNNLDLNLIGNTNLGNGCVPILKTLFNMDA